MGTSGAIWGLVGVFLLLGSAVYRLSSLAISAFSFDFSWYHWLFLIFIVLFMGYAEGYRGFQQRFSPRVVARAKYLKEHPRVLHVILGPLFCMGYFYATRKRKITSITLTLGVILLVLLVRLLPQPWRGIIDAGVVLGLIWGLVSMVIFTLLAFTSKRFNYSPEVPERP
jgi:hypothetical protein